MELDRSVVSRPRRQGRVALAAVAVLGGAALTGCGSSTHGAQTASAAGTPLQQGCAAVAAVLANGPDPTADPVGYAEAQIIPLRKVATGSADLEHAVAGLSSAYKEYFSTNGSSAAKSAVTQASAKVDAICPGAAS